MPRDVHAETIECRCFTRPCSSGDDEVRRSTVETFDPDPHHCSEAGIDRSELNQVNHGQWIFLELSNGERWTIRRNRWNGSVHTRSIGKTAVENGNHPRPITEWDIGEGGNVLCNLQASLIIDPDVGSAHSVLPMSNLDALGSTIVHDFFQIVVLEEDSKIAMRVWCNRAFNVVNW